MWGRLELNEQTAVGLRERLAALGPDMAPRWGRMSATGMLTHVADTFAVSLGNKAVPDVSNWFTRNVLFHLVFKGVPLPRNVKVPPEFIPAPGEDFEAERRAVLEGMAGFLAAVATAPDRRILNPGFGPLALRQWALIHGKHLDHHLTQFGV